MKNRLLLALMLVCASLGWAAAGFGAFGALVMSPMIFTSQKTLHDPDAWLFIGASIVLLLFSAAGLALQWICFAVKWNKLATGIAALPLLGLLFVSGPGWALLTGSRTNLWGPDIDFNGITYEVEAIPNREVRFETYCPGLDSTAPLRLTVYPYIAGVPRAGLPMAHVGGERWSVTFRYPESNLVFNYQLENLDQSPAHPRHYRRPTTDLDLRSDTLLIDTVHGWLELAPLAPHYSGATFDQITTSP